MEPVFEGSDISWEIRDDTLCLKGEGEMKFPYDEENDRLAIPWYYEDFTKVSFEGNITSIGPEAFHTSDLIEVKIPDSVERIDQLAFCSCKSLEKVTFGRHLRAIGGYAFEGCEKLKRVVLGGCVESLGYSCFEGCTSLISFETSPVLRLIDHKVFSGCTSLVRISLMDKVARINGNPFMGCTSLREISVSPFNSAYSSQNGILYNRASSVLIAVPGATAGEFTVPESVVEIGREALSGCMITSARVPATVRSMDVGVFADCRQLRSVTIEHRKSVHGLRFRDRILRAGMFGSCTSLMEVYLPDDLETVEFGAFEGCHALKTVRLPDSVERISEKAFLDSGLEEIELPARLQYIGPMAFAECRCLRHLRFNDNLVSIDGQAFRNCRMLTELDIPESVVEIEADAFEGCRGLRKVILRSSAIEPGEIFPEGVETIVPDSE
ncbi:MAG: leucine-rich repeat domain-containing protein [Candidatus Methanomethylophilus sp.]|nr:leucine-rich repeat domain-containing protein [Methanomethylophilus sp.]